MSAPCSVARVGHARGRAICCLSAAEHPASTSSVTPQQRDPQDAPRRRACTLGELQTHERASLSVHLDTCKHYPHPPRVRWPGRVSRDRSARSPCDSRVPPARATSTARPPSRCTRRRARCCSPRSTGYADPRRLHRAGRDARLLLDNAREATADASASAPTRSPSPPRGTARGPPRAARAVAGAARRRRRPLGRRALGGPARGRLGRAGPTRSPVDRRRPGRRGDLVATRSARRRRGGRAARQPRGRHPPAGRRAASCPTTSRSSSTPARRGPAPAARRLGRRGGLGPQVGRPGRRRACCWCARAPAGATRSPATTGPTSAATGFENVPAVLAAAAALQAVVAERDEVDARQHALVDASARRVAAEVPDVEVVGDPDDRLPHLVTFSCLYVDGEALVTELDRRGFGVASGSACTASTLAPSHVLAAMGVLTHGNVRVSLQRDTTAADVDALLRRAARRSSPRSGRGWACERGRRRRPRARLPRPALPAAGHRARPALADVAVGELLAVVAPRPAARGRRAGVVPDAGAGVRRRGRRRRRRAAVRGTPASAEPSSGPDASGRCGSTSAAASSP